MTSSRPVGKAKITNKTFEDYFIFAITVQNGKDDDIRECFDTLATARVCETTEP